MMYVSVVGLFLSDMSRTDSKTSPCATIFVSLDGSLLRDIHLFCRCHLSDIGVDSTSLQKYRHGGEICLSLCVSLRDIAFFCGSLLAGHRHGGGAHRRERTSARLAAGPNRYKFAVEIRRNSR